MPPLRISCSMGLLVDGGSGVDVRCACVHARCVWIAEGQKIKAMFQYDSVRAILEKYLGRIQTIHASSPTLVVPLAVLVTPKRIHCARELPVPAPKNVSVRCTAQLAAPPYPLHH